MNIKDYGFKENLIRNNMEGKIPARIIATHKRARLQNIRSNRKWRIITRQI